MLSHNYGWDTEYILDKSLYEIYWRLRKICDRINSERTFIDSLHGIDLKTPIAHKEGNIKLDDDQEKAMAIALERAKQRKRSEYGK